MKRGLTLVGCMTLLAASHQAGELSADCAGWTIKANLNVYWQIDAVVTLERMVDGEYVVWDTSTDSGTFLNEICLQNIWNVGLPDGLYRASAVEEVLDLNTGARKTYLTGPIEFTCTSVSMRTPGYWKTHPEAWPELVLPLGPDGLEYSQDCLMEVLWSPVQGDIRIILAKHLIAAKLNVLAGTVDSVATTITNADIYLGPFLQAEGDDCPDPFFLGGRPSGVLKQEGRGLKDILDAFNNNEL